MRNDNVGAFQYLLKVLDGCIQRCEAKRGALMDYM